MSRLVHLGDFHPALEGALAGRLRELCPAGDARRLLVVVPNRRLGIHLRRRMAQLDVATVGLAPRALEDLVVDWAGPAIAAGGLRPMPDWSMPWLVAEAGPVDADAAGADGVGAAPAGWTGALAATFRDLRDAGVSARDFAEGLAAAGLGGDRLRHAAATYRRLEALLRRRRLADRALSSDLATEAVAAEGGPLAAVDHVVVYGLYDLVERQRRLLAALFEARPCDVFFPWDGGPAFAFARPLLDWLVESGFERRRWDRELPLDDRRALAARLFDEAPASAVFAGDGSVRLLSAPSPGREPLEALRGLAADPPDSALVLLRRDDTTLAGFRLAGRRAGIPLDTPAERLAETPAGRVAALLGELAFGGGSGGGGGDGVGGGAPESVAWPRARIEELLACSGLADDPAFAGARIGRWPQALRGRRLVAGRAAWRRFLDRHGPGSAQSALPFAAGGETGEEEEMERDPRLVRELPRAAAWAGRLFETLAELETPGRTWTRTREAWDRALVRWVRPGADLEALRLALAGWASLDGVLPARPAACRAALAAALETPAPRAEGEPRYGDAPSVVGIPAGRGLTADDVVLPDLVEGSFPRRGREDPVLLDEERRRLNAAWADAAPARRLRLALRRADTLAEERLLFRLAAGAARRRLWLSWSRRGEDGSTRLPSSFLHAAARALLGPAVRFEEVEGLLAARVVPRSALAAASRQEPLLPVERDLRLLAEGAPERIAGWLRRRPRLARGLRAERWRRERPHRLRLTEYDGLIDPELARAWWESRRRDPASGAPRLSASALETYARCGFRYLQRDVLRVSAHPPPERLLDLDGAARGRLVHAALRALHARIGAEVGWPLEGERLERARALIEPALDAVVAERPALVDELVPVLWGRRRKRLVEDLARLVEHEAGSRFRPWRLEWPIDAVVRLGASRVALRGRVDRIDRLEDEAGAATLRIVDYKTSRRRTAAPGAVEGGTELQLPLYRRAVLAAPGPEFEAAAGPGRPPAVIGAYWHVGLAASDWTTDWSEADFERADGDLDRIGDGILAGIAGGEMFQVEGGASCGFCDFRLVCGPGREARLADKARDPRVERASGWRGRSEAAGGGEETP